MWQRQMNKGGEDSKETVVQIWWRVLQDNLVSSTELMM